MNVQRIAIKKTMISLNQKHDYWYEFESEGNILPFTVSYGEPLPKGICNFEKIRYRIFERIDLEGEKKYYGVREDEQGLFTELIECAEISIKRKIEETIQKRLKVGEYVTREKHIDTLSATRDSAVSQIKMLPWWKRLLGKF